MASRPAGFAWFSRRFPTTAPFSLSLVLFMAVADPQAGEAAVRALPGEITLSGPEARQRLLVERVEGEQYVGQVRESVEWKSSNADVALVEDGIARPVGNGSCTLTVKAGDHEATARVTVTGQDEPFTWSFRNHVQSVLTKAGCNSGACHGAQAGKKGFKLSLRGYDSQGDWHVLTREARGRRIVPGEPGRSLILTKPTGLISHKGGLRFDVGSLEYRVIAEWIAAGAPAPQDDDPRITHLEVLPKRSVLEPASEQQLVVLAHFDDGHHEDVTRWAKYTSTNQSVAMVGDSGNVQVVGHGEGAITAWYLSKIVVATVSVPYDTTVNPQMFVEAPRRNFIDEHVFAKLQALNLPPSPPATDAEFLRRAYLDTIGVLPTAAEAREFLADDSPDKRDRLIERLLERPEFVDYWTYNWSDLMLVNSAKLPSPAMWAYYNWIRRHVRENTPWDELVRRLLTATGSTLENGATNFFVLHQDPQSLAETSSQAFLGMSIGCAKCHNHPLEKWTNDQYYGMASLFARVRTKDATGDGNRIVFSADRGELIQPLKGKPQPPRPLDGETIPFSSTADRRDHLAEWLTAPENPYFTRAIVNRVWANFLGVGLVEKVDDVRLTNPASNEQLLDALADYLVDEKYDLKSLMRLILQSTAYQRSSRPLPGNTADERFYSRYYPRRLKAEILLDAYSQVTGAPSKFPGFPEGWRAMQLPDTNVESYFLKTFGRPERVITCACERSDEPSMTQVLHIANGDVLLKKLGAKGNRIDQLLAEDASDVEVVEELYLAALSRHPTPEEKQRLVTVLSEAALEKPGDEQRRTVIEDLFWSVLSSRSFLFNH